MDIHISDTVVEKDQDAVLKNIVKKFRDVNLHEDKEANGNTI